MANAEKRKVDWPAVGRAAILDLLGDRLVVPWAEAEGRISSTGWKDFPSVQPLQLHEARRSLEAEDAIVHEITEHEDLPVSTIRLPYPRGRKREVERLRGERRKLYRKFLSWAADQNLCGKHAERVVLASLQSASGDAGIFVPKQTVGLISGIGDCGLERGPLDALAHVLALPEIRSDCDMVVEVKNVHRWIYPWMPELWELLVKAAELAQCAAVLPVLVCMRSSFMTTQMAKDLGFFVCQLTKQIFSPTIDAAEFDATVAEFGLPAIQHPVGSIEPVTSLATKVLRMSPPASPPYEEIAWYKRQVHRFSTIAPTVLAYDALAQSLDDASRRSAFRSFASQVQTAFTWPSAKGWF